MATTNQKPKYLELADHLRESIRRGDLKAGQRLPSYTELYQQHGATTATIQRAWDILDQDQLIVRRHGSGMFVASPQRNVTGTIGLIGSPSFTLQESPFHFRLTSGVYQQVQENQKQMLYLGSCGSWDASALAKVDGVLFCVNDAEIDIVLRELPADMPRVAILTNVDCTSSAASVTSVGVDEYHGGQIAVRYLMEFGHKRIACLMQKPAWQARRRLAGYIDALQASGIEDDPAWRLMGGPIKERPGQMQPYLEWGREHMTDWLQNGWHETGCTALLVQNDVAAIGAMQVLQKEGIRVPEDVSIIGFDGTEICDLISPRLSAVALPLAEIGAKAVELLYRQIDGEASSAEKVLLPLSVRPGESVAPPR